MKIKLSAFADEAAVSYSEQLKVLTEERMPCIELRGLDGKNITLVSEDEAKRYAEQTAAAGITVWSIGSPIGKIGINEDFESHLSTAEHTFRLAKIFGTDRIRVFSFYTETPEEDRAEVMSRMKRLLRLADECGVTLYHENEKEIYGDTAERCADLLDNNPQLKSVFDPANYVQCNEDIPAALKLLRKKTDYYHIKDALYAGGEVVPAGLGDGHLVDVISGICEDTALTLEPHLTIFEGYTILERSQRKMKYAYKTSREAFAAAAEALRAVLRKCGFKEDNGVWIK